MERQGEYDTATLLRQARVGDDRATRARFHRYAVRLTHIAEQHINRKRAGRLDGEDVVQSVIRTFYPRIAGGVFQ